MRLQKYMAECGVASRRACEEIIAAGRVEINGVVASIGESVDEGDVVEIDGEKICPAAEKVYYMLFKPVGVITTAKDDRGRKTVLDLIDTQERIYPVGRLDINTSGLLLLTNDGELTNGLTHPSNMVDKTYKALVDGEITQNELDALEKGVVLEDGITAPAKVRLIKIEKDKSYAEITIHEGRNRQVRRMFEAIGHEVLALRRIKIGSLGLNGLEKGQYRELTKEEVDYLKGLAKR